VDPRLLDRGYSKEQIAVMRATMKNGGLDETKWHNLKFTKELTEYQHPHFAYLMQMHDLYREQGVLPFNGSHSDQPAQILEYFDILSQLHMDREAKMRANQEREARQMKGNNGRR
jgi:hypothetical protein